jgi:hypothetical protein
MYVSSAEQLFSGLIRLNHPNRFISDHKNQDPAGSPPLKTFVMRAS